MKYINYKNDTLSKLVLGTVQFGLDYGVANKTGKPTQGEVDAIVDFLYGKGLNTFDTAQAYGDSEKVLGQAIKDKKDIFVISKLKSEEFDDRLIEKVDRSLEFLGAGSLYGLLMHDCTMLYNWNTRYEKMIKDLLGQQKIKNFGVSIYTQDEFDKALDNEFIDFIQIPFNIFDQRAVSLGWFEKAKKKNKLLFIRSVFLQGLLLMHSSSTPKKLLHAKPYLEKLELLCRKYNMKKNRLAMSFVNTLAADSLIVFGCDNLFQAKENLKEFNDLESLKPDIIEELTKTFKEIDQSVNNPSRW